jgi:peptidyl-prolyl cis-trans isomerase SurA
MELSSGKNFDDVALKFSADPSVADNKGNLGYLTVFSLPYRFENIIYGLAPGKFSAPVKSNSGYHIFKNNSERKAAGKMKAMQILLVLPPGSEPDTRKKIGALADSLYHRLQKGDDFSMLATTFSNDIVSAASGGQMAEFGLGTYDPVFESAAFALPANGAVSKPFLTSHGYHIVKRISLTAPSAANDKKTTELLRSQVERDSRINEAREILYKKILDKAGYKPGNLNLQQVKIFTDSAWEFKPAAPNSPIHNTDILFTIGNKPRTVSDLIGYGHSNRANPDGSGVKSFNQVMEDFKRQATMDYYRDHLEDYNPAFEQQMKELKEGNLFFDIMMKEVWSKSQSDSAGMAAYFENNKTKYVWKNSAAAVIFYCGDEASAGELKKALTNNPADWKMVAEGFSSQVTFDSARFEINKIPGLKNTTPKPGLITAVETNKDDNSASFAYIIKLYNQPAQKTLAEAKSELVTDFQDDIDRKWADELRKKYNLKINTAAQNTLK